MVTEIGLEEYIQFCHIILQVISNAYALHVYIFPENRKSIQ